MALKGMHRDARLGGDRPSHVHHGVDQAMNNLGWFRGPVAKCVAAAGVGLAVGFVTVVAHAATSPSPSVSPDVGPSNSASPSTGSSPSTAPSPGSGSGRMNCPNM